jgi:moderate conductance mechanosensitive channel
MASFQAIDWVHVASILTGGAVAWYGIRRISRIVRRTLVVGELDLDSEKRAVTLMRAVRYGLGVILALVVLLLLLSEFGISIAPLLGAAGVAGIAIGLAAQGIVKDLLRGFSLLLDNQLRVGDVVEVAGKTGTVEALTLRCVRLREYDGTVHFVRTGDVDTVTNRSFAPIHAVLDVAVDTEADLGSAFKVIEESAEALRVDPSIEPLVLGPIEIAGIERWEDDSVLIRSRIPVRPHAQATVRRALLARVKSGMDAAGIANPTQRLRLLRDGQP